MFQSMAILAKYFKIVFIIIPVILILMMDIKRYGLTKPFCQVTFFDYLLVDPQGLEP